MLPNTEHMTEVEDFFCWIKQLYRTDLTLPTTMAQEQQRVSSVPLLPPAALGFWQSSAMEEPSPAPSLPSSDLSFLQSENPRPSHCGHRDESTESPTATWSTQLTNSWTTTSTFSCSPQSSQPTSSCRDAEIYCGSPFDTFVDDSVTSELLARDAKSRPLGCGLGTSLRPLAPSSPTFASALRLEGFDDFLNFDQRCASSLRPEGFDGSLKFDDCYVRPAASGMAQHNGNRNESLVGATEHALRQRPVAQKRPPPTVAPCTWSPLPSPRCLAWQELDRKRSM